MLVKKYQKLCKYSKKHQNSQYSKLFHLNVSKIVKLVTSFLKVYFQCFNGDKRLFLKMIKNSSFCSE